jgi:hypothetical protein
MLSGPLPTELAQLSALEFLLLNRNELSGGIPIEFSGLTSLRMLALLDRDVLQGSKAPWRICATSLMSFTWRNLFQVRLR